MSKITRQQHSKGIGGFKFLVLYKESVFAIGGAVSGYPITKLLCKQI